MKIKMWTMLLAMLGLAAIAAPAHAAQPSEAFSQRAAQIVTMINGKADLQEMFSPAFLSQVPAAQMNAISAQLTSQFGTAQGVARIEAKTPNSGTIFIDMEKAVLQMDLAVAAAPPHRIEGLLITGNEAKDDSLAKVLEELRALPGQTSFSIARLGEGAPAPLIAHQADRPLAIGSAFKLFILAELSRSIQAGERKWDDVATLDHRSLPSGFLQKWPNGAPMTLYSLAALMISQSDNTATDTLLHLLDREKVEAMMPVAGVRAPERNRPFLSTLEAFALKSGDPAMADAWLKGTEVQRRALLASKIRGIGADKIDVAKLTGAPNRIDTVEWFASADDLVRTMDWLRRNGDARTHEILAINPGLAPTAADDFAYLGFKGGSEPGVINLTFLAGGKDGAWHAASGSWNNPAAKVDELKFVTLLGRALALLP